MNIPAAQRLNAPPRVWGRKQKGSGRKNLFFLNFFIPGVCVYFVAAGSTCPAILLLAETDGKIPFAKGCYLTDMFGQITGMNLMTGPAGPALLLVNMYIMKILIAIPEIRMGRGFLDRDQRFLVAFET